MTRDEIIDAAFRAWGVDGFRTNSLSAVSAELGVTKPALYKHFRAKEELLEAVSVRFFDRYSGILKEAFSRGRGGGAAGAPAAAGSTASIDGVLDIFLGMFADDWVGFISYLSVVLGLPKPHERIRTELEARGVSIPKSPLFGSGPTLLTHFALSSGLFSLALFHGSRADRSQRPGPEAAAAAIGAARSLVHGGIAWSQGISSDYPLIEARARIGEHERGEVHRLLGAIAAAVAEAGPWKASMDLVAKKAGMSKSGIYAHFKDRDEMLASMFETEYERIASVLGPRIEACEGLPDRLYAAMATTAEYLIGRPEVLAALDWVRAQRIDLRVAFPERILAHYRFLEREAEAGRCRLIEGSLDLTLRWIHFLVVNYLVHGSWQEGGMRGGMASLPRLHRLILGGIDMEPPGGIDMEPPGGIDAEALGGAETAASRGSDMEISA
ncbi:MAG TPA: TetR/AcrR family transcriptional regulator [Rectinemataceae bacterium]|nr:TetR/AcrR family transcriptional regulator [Rectinemataceae bacterium]